MHVAIIGSGLAGLTAGAALAQAGHRVTVLEQFDRPGGVTAPFERDGYRWDLGQLLIEGLGDDEPVGRILDELGVLDWIGTRVEDRTYVFPDWELSKPADYEGRRWRLRRLRERFPDEAGGLERYWADYLRFTSVMTLARRMEAARGPAATFWKLRLALKALPLRSKQSWNAQQLMDHYFRSDQLKLVFTSILADFFTAPREFQGLGVFALNPEASFDTRLPRELASGAVQLCHYSVLGGIGKLADALAEKIRAHYGEIHTGRPVARIAVRDGRVEGVVDAGGRLLKAGCVVASGGARETFLRLVGEEHLPAGFSDKVRSIPLMGSVFMVHLGVEADPMPPFKGIVTYYYGTYDIDRAIADGRSGIYHEGRDGFVVHVPSLHSPEMAPPGHHAVTIYTIAPDRLAEGDWETRREEYTGKLIDYAEARIPGLRRQIRVRHTITPDDWRARTHLEHHAFGGIAPIMGSWRVPHRSPVEGLWFVGAQSQSGGGVNAVIPGAYKAARAILEGK